MDNYKALMQFLANEKGVDCEVKIDDSLNDGRLKSIEQIEKLFVFDAKLFKAALKEFGCVLPSTRPLKGWDYACYLYYVLMQIKNIFDGRQITVTEEEVKQVENGILLAIEYGMKPFFRQLKEAPGDSNAMTSLTSSVTFLTELIKTEPIAKLQHLQEFKLIVVQVITSIFILLRDADHEQANKYHKMLEEISKLMTEIEYFKMVFLVKSNRDLDVGSQKIIHKHLTKCLMSPGGFSALCHVLLPVTSDPMVNEDKLPPGWQRCHVIANIVATKGHSRQFYHSMVDEIFRFLIECSDPLRIVNPFFRLAAVQCLSKMYALQRKDIQMKIESVIFERFDRMSDPEDLLNGIILSSEADLKVAIDVLQAVFCIAAPSEITLPSKLLIGYLPVMFQLHSLLGSVPGNLRAKISALLSRCLSNREISELNRLIEILLHENYDVEMRELHPRVVLRHILTEANTQTFTLQIGSDERDNDEDGHYYDASRTLIEVLKESKHNILTYNVFLQLLELFAEQKPSPTNADNEFIDSEDELAAFMSLHFKKQYVIVNALNELILHQPFHSQFSENPQKIVELFERILRGKMTRIENPKSVKSVGRDEEIIIILSIIQEFLTKITNHEQEVTKRLIKTLREFKSNCRSELIGKKISFILNEKPSSDSFSEHSPFSMAKSLLGECTEPHLRVYGMKEFTKLLAAKDSETLSNVHSVLAIAMKVLRGDGDSYVFLNCIKLLVVLFDVLEATVFDTLIAEYHQPEDGTEEDVDYRLKVGETILKVSEGLGGMAYKHKNILISCFLRGANHPQNEFRTSNYANLGVLCRILSYQVHHFFQEMMFLIQRTLETDKYVPARRAAASVLSNLLNGIEQLTDFEDCLLPIFRLLKNMSDNDDDLQVRVHAQKGLDRLKQKVKQFLLPEQNMQKEIQIFGVKDRASGGSGRKGHILEIT